MDNKPKFLYRYRNLDDLKYREDEINGKLFVTSPKGFNDFYDSFSMLCSENFSLYLSRLDPNTDKEILKWVQSLILEEYETMNVKLNEILRSTGRIACFNEGYQNMPMWYHYADKYKGICLEYDVDKIPKNLFAYLKPVNYVDALPDGVKWFKTKHNKEESEAFNSLDEFYYSKLNDWKYEKEWRIVLPIGVFYSSHEQIPEDKLFSGELISFIKPSKVILGFEISKENEETIRTYCAVAGIEVVKIKATQYGLKL